MKLLHREQDKGSVITVRETEELYGEQGRFRVLEFANGDAQGALDLNDPGRIVLEYPRAIVHLMEHNDPSFERAFVIGHGIGTISRHFADKAIRTAEISGKIIQLSRLYFGYDGQAEVGDGRDLLSREPDGLLDYVVLDAFTEKGVPWHLFTRECFQTAADKLDEHGAILINMFGRGRRDVHTEAVWATLADVFPHRRGFALPQEDPRDPMNRILVGSKRPIEAKMRQMAGFVEDEPERGTILDDDMFG
ncbi:spermidine synthase [Saccharibacillus qingshengii]|uniref:spermidine synthase n=1 Tax=Saccharibacillus qingshengii TaxID=1763540 RepID=UPI00155271CC|nr:fused MFS/spermidine synthase [Saccharibacillus qingshengii]